MKPENSNKKNLLTFCNWLQFESTRGSHINIEVTGITALVRKNGEEISIGLDFFDCVDNLVENEIKL